MSMNIKQIFEYELHRKLSLRANSINSEINLLTNAFKFYDIDDSGIIKKEDFAKVMGKIGVSGLSNNDLYKLFDIYDVNKVGSINYVNFIEYMYDLAPLKPLNRPNEFLQNTPKRIPHFQIQQIKETRLKTPYISYDGKEVNLPTKNFEIEHGQNNQINYAPYEEKNSNIQVKTPIEPTFQQILHQTPSLFNEERIKSPYSHYNNQNNLNNQNNQNYINNQNNQNYLNNQNNQNYSNNQNNQNYLNNQNNQNYLNNQYNQNYQNYLNNKTNVTEYAPYEEKTSTIKVKNPIEPTFQQITQNYKPLYKPITPLRNDNNIYKIKSHFIQDTNDYSIPYSQYNNSINKNYSNNNNYEKKDNNYQDIRPQSTKIKKYFQTLLQQIQNQININNGLTYYTLLSKINEKQDKIFKSLSCEKLQSCIKESGINIDNSLIKDFYNLIDFTEQNKVSSDEILRQIRGFLHENRKLKIVEKFSMLDINKIGQCDIDLIKNSFNANKHPDVINGKRRENDIKNEFNFTFDTFIKYKEKYNQISLDDFIEYYSPISSSINNDNYFNDIMNGVWSTITFHKQSRSFDNTLNNYNNNNNYNNYDNNNNKIINYHNLQNTNNINQNNERYNQIKQEINISNSSRENMNKRPYSNIHYKSYRTETPSYNIITGNYYNNTNNNYYNIQRNNNLYYSYDISNNSNKFENPNENDSNIDSINKLRSMLLSRGPKSLFIIEKMLSMYDNNHTGKIDFNTLEKIIQAYKLPLTHEEILNIFKNIDKNNTGIINYDYLIRKIVGNMTSKRQNLINQVFNSLTNGYNEEISIINLKNKYNASRHPEVVACKKSLDEIKNEFNENLDIFKEYITPLSTSSHDFINYNDFIKFYNQISLGISDEKYFDYLINNVWNLDNGDEKHYYNYGRDVFGKIYNV